MRWNLERIYPFDSKAEMRRWLKLEELEARNVIYELQRQVTFPLSVNGFHVCDYVADAVYKLRETGEKIVEDTKGVRLADYRIKAKLMWAIYRIQIQEVRA
jgi:hypothetical protein